MKVNSCCSSIMFTRKLKPEEQADYTSVLSQAKEKVGNKGHSTLIVPTTSLPHSINNNTGCGNLLNKESLEFFDFAKQYWGINYVQILPEGNLNKGNHVFNPYSRSSVDLGTQLINLNLLTEKRYGCLLDKEDIDKVISANTDLQKDIRINYENTLESDSQTEKALRKAFDRLMEGDTPEKKQLLKDFEIFYEENKEWLEGKAIFRVLSKKNGTNDYTQWNDKERNLFNTDRVSLEERKKIIDELLFPQEAGKEMTFYEFTQFLADRHLQEAKETLNKKGIKLSGDMPVGSTADEKWMFPKAFYQDKYLPWHHNAINFDTEEGKEFLRLKVRNLIKHYDGIRIDASWLYAEQKLLFSNKVVHKVYDAEILDIIDDEIRKVKGKDYDLQNVTHEFMANPKDYVIYDDNSLKEEAIDRVKIYFSEYLSDDGCSVDAYKKCGWKDGTYIIGATNHDATTLRELYQNTEVRNEQIETLSRILKIPKEKIESLSGFINAKFAEPIRCMHNMVFFADALNLDGSYRSRDKVENFRLKIPSNYQDIYFSSLEKGEGFNIMDALEKAFVADGLDKTEPELYKKIIKYRDILNGTEKPETHNNPKGKGKWIAIAATAVIAVTAAIAVFKNKQNKSSEKKNV